MYVVKIGIVVGALQEILLTTGNSHIPSARKTLRLRIVSKDANSYCSVCCMVLFKTYLTRTRKATDRNG